MHSNTLANPQVDDRRIGSLVVVVVAAVVVVSVVVSIVVSAAAVPAVVVASPPREPEAQGKIFKMRIITHRNEKYPSTAQQNVQTLAQLALLSTQALQIVARLARTSIRGVLR